MKQSKETKIQRALVSVSDKEGIVELCSELKKQQVQIISTGNTHQSLLKRGIESTPIESYTQFPELLDGRVKTLHPKVFGGILADRENALHKKQLEEKQIPYLDLIVVNLYPFQKVSETSKEFSELIEAIDIGGMSLLRAGAKNFQFVTVLSDPSDYTLFLEEFSQNKIPSLSTRYHLACLTFKRCTEYDHDIFTTLSEKKEKISTEKFYL